MNVDRTEMCPISIIIPAHNEEAVIDRCLEALRPGLETGEFEAIVVCNGCSDHTADRARQFGHHVRVIETDIPSKANALNLGDADAAGFPRIYLDADIGLDAESIRHLAATLQRPDIEAAAPAAVTNLDGCSWPVRAFYRIWTQTPYFKQGMIGCGVYALNQAGRARFDSFPNIIADDGYVRAMFSDGRTALAGEAKAEVRAPRRWMALIKVMTRSRLGGYQLAQVYPELVAREMQTKDYGGTVKAWLRQPWLWPHVAVYVVTNLVCRARAKRQLARGKTNRWERDTSTRVGA